VPLNVEIAEIIGKLNAYLIANGLPIEYQDVAIAATFIYEKGDWLLTENKKHFTIIPGVEKTAVTPAEFKKRTY
jgi:predicted nucleic acid-binding protein